MMTINEWLENCPCPVVARIIDNQMDLQHLLDSSHVYQESVLVVIDLKSISKEETWES